MLSVAVTSESAAVGAVLVVDTAWSVKSATSLPAASFSLLSVPEPGFA